MTTCNNLGPPGGRDDEGRPPSKRGADHAEPAAATPPNADKHSSRRSAETLPWRRRREASRRLPPLHCGCRDPWLCRCSRPPMSDQWVDAGAQAAHHLLDVGYPPLLELDVLRALWRRGGDDRQLAQQLYELVGGDGA